MPSCKLAVPLSDTGQLWLPRHLQVQCPLWANSGHSLRCALARFRKYYSSPHKICDCRLIGSNSWNTAVISLTDKGLSDQAAIAVGDALGERSITRTC